MFIVIEGLDGSGKTSASRQLTYFLQAKFKKKAKLTFEPHDASCGGLFIRQVLEKKITTFSDETLALAFAANRLDHGDREIKTWLNDETDNSILICDRYYLSSLVYQSNERLSFEYVMDLNKHARKPDLIFFMNVSNEVCYQRMDIRNKPKELFEHSLSATRDKYNRAIQFLEETRGEKVIRIDASGTIQGVVVQMLHEIFKIKPEWKKDDVAFTKDFKLKQPHRFSGKTTITAQGIINKIKTTESDINELCSTLEFDDLATLFLEYIQSLGFELGSQISGTTTDAFALRYTLPAGIVQRGAAIIIKEAQRYDAILGSASMLNKMNDFIFVFTPDNSEAITTYYERDMIQYADGEQSLFPAAKIITTQDLKDWITKNL